MQWMLIDPPRLLAILRYCVQNQINCPFSEAICMRTSHITYSISVCTPSLSRFIFLKIFRPGQDAPRSGFQVLGRLKLEVEIQEPSWRFEI